MNTMTIDERRRRAAQELSAQGLVDPTATAENKKSAAARLATLKDARGVLLDNTKGNAGPLLCHVGNLLEERYGTAPLPVSRKLVYSRPADPALLDELAESYEFAVTGVGACGSCTSGCVRDAVDLEARGVPTVAIHTEVFMNSATAHTDAFGRPDLRFVSVRHPIAAVSDEELRERALAVVDSVAQLLTGERA